MINDPRNAGDAAAYAGGLGGSVAAYSQLAGQITPILSAAFVLLSILWLLWRFWDRLRFGPKVRGDDD